MNNIILLIFLLTLSIETYSKEFHRNPFEPPIDINFSDYTTTNNSNFNIKLTGIIWDKKEPSAVIKMGRFKKIIKVGDFVNTYKVKSITKKHIVLKNETNETTKIMLKLGEEIRF